MLLDEGMEYLHGVIPSPSIALILKVGVAAQWIVKPADSVIQRASRPTP